MPFLLEAIHTYIFVASIDQFGVFESALIFTALVYLIGFPFYLAFKAIFPAKGPLFLLIYCLIASSIGALPFWAGPGVGLSYNIVLTIQIILLPFGVYFFFLMLDKIGIIKFERQSPSISRLALFLIVLFILPVATIIDGIFFDGQYIFTKTGEYSVLLALFGLSAMGAITCFLLLMPIVGFVSLLSATIRWISKDRASHSESSLNKKSKHSSFDMKLQDCGCGGIPHVTVNTADKNLFTVSCLDCGNSTLGYDNYHNAQLIWNTWGRKQGYRIAGDATA